MQVTSKTEWLLQVPEIRAELAAIETPVVDRSMVEQLFRLKRRRSIELMHQLGGFQSGRTFLIDRLQLLRQLEEIEAAPEFERARRRRERLSETLARLRREKAAASVSIRVSGDVFDRKWADLPTGIRVEPGMLTVQFEKAVDLLQKLFELAQAIANDFERFESAAEKAGSG